MSLEFVQLIVLILPPILYSALALWIRPSWKIIGLSLVTGFVMGSLNLLGDMLAFSQGWWRYPFTTANHAPLTFYLATALFYGAGIMGLVGWWARKRFGRRGGIFLLVLFPLWGFLRDFGGSSIYNQTQTMIVWGEGFVPGVADFLLWASAGAAGLFTMVGLEKWWGKPHERSG
jgi:hypothetical protein